MPIPYEDYIVSEVQTVMQNAGWSNLTVMPRQKGGTVFIDFTGTKPDQPKFMVPEIDQILRDYHYINVHKGKFVVMDNGSAQYSARVIKPKEPI